MKLTSAADEFREGLANAFGGSESPTHTETQDPTNTPDETAARAVIKSAKIIAPDPDAFLGSNTLNITVANVSEVALRRMHIGVKIVTEGRTYPWAEDDFWIMWDGGIEPGETRQGRFSLPSKLERAELSTDRQAIYTILGTE